MVTMSALFSQLLGVMPLSASHGKYLYIKPSSQTLDSRFWSRLCLSNFLAASSFWKLVTSTDPSTVHSNHSPPCRRRLSESRFRFNNAGKRAAIYYCLRLTAF